MRRSRWLVALVVVCCGIAGALFWIFFRAAGRISAFGPVASTLPAEKDQARKAGLLLEPKELRRRPPVPDSQNAAALYRKIDALYREDPEEQRKEEGDLLTAANRPKRTDTDREAARAILQRNAKILPLAERASHMPHCDFHRRYEGGAGLLFPELATMRALARLFAVRAALESDAGRPMDALTDIATIGRIANHTDENDSIIIPTLVHIALEAIMDRSFVLIIATHRDKPAVLRRAREIQDAMGPEPQVARTLAGELVMGRMVIQEVRDGQVDSGDLLKAFRSVVGDSPNRAAVTKMICDGWEARYLSYLRRTVSALRAAKGDLLAQYKGVQPISDAEMAHEHEPTYELESILIAVYDEVVLKLMRDEAQRRLRSVALDLLEYRLRHHAYPASLAELPAKLADDPFTDRPFLYKRTSTGCLVYSVGENFKDDGGSTARDEKKRTLDLVVELPN